MIYNPGELADVREFVRHPGWRVLVRAINDIESDAKNRVIAQAWVGHIDDIKKASGQLVGVQDVIKILNGMVNEASNTQVRKAE